MCEQEPRDSKRSASQEGEGRREGDAGTQDEQVEGTKNRRGDGYAETDTDAGWRAEKENGWHRWQGMGVEGVRADMDWIQTSGSPTQSQGQERGTVHCDIGTQLEDLCRETPVLRTSAHPQASGHRLKNAELSKSGVGDSRRQRLECQPRCSGGEWPDGASKTVDPAVSLRKGIV
ncbi:hypothetical protein C8R44DRAFT_732694 [Mycena epipterygia]|nr:hypothetical protein C8R44DRAFT_732694 [Mycena epipterygia]